MMPTPCRVAFVHGSRAGVGGLGHSVAGAASGLSPDWQVAAFGPGYQQPWSLPGEVPAFQWHLAPVTPPDWLVRYSWLRWRNGELVYRRNRSLGRWAAARIAQYQPQAVYGFTEVSLETLRWARQHGVPTVLDNPNGHIRNFAAVYEREFRRWCSGPYHGHPTHAMVERVEEEYALADRVRMYAAWGVDSMQSYGVSAGKLWQIPHAINLQRFQPPAAKQPATGPLRLCYVGSLCLRKGFVYLLRALRRLGPDRFRLRIVGATGDRHTARLLAAERQGLHVEVAPGDPLEVYHTSELFVLPTLEDGYPFVLAEALACGLPVITTGQAGLAECVRPGESGWVVPAASEEAIAAALEAAWQQRQLLPEMGRLARRDVEQYAGAASLQRMRTEFAALLPTACPC